VIVGGAECGFSRIVPGILIHRILIHRLRRWRACCATSPDVPSRYAANQASRGRRRCIRRSLDVLEPDRMDYATPKPCFRHRIRVRYSEIDGQAVVFNSRYLEYADVAITEYYRSLGISSMPG